MCVVPILGKDYTAEMEDWLLDNKVLAGPLLFSTRMCILFKDNESALMFKLRFGV
jgi:hypothetical protein